jgi:hypothetical protein
VGEMEIDINGLHLDEIELKHDAFSIDPYFITGRFECVIDIERDFERRNTNDLVLKLGKNEYEIYDFKLIEPQPMVSNKLVMSCTTVFVVRKNVIFWAKIPSFMR